jgi:hypothetical protein
MSDEDLTLEEALQGLHELFGSQDSSVPARRCRTYVLELASGNPVFRLADSDYQVSRSEIETMVDQIIEEVSGDDIVPMKLARLFPG